MAEFILLMGEYWRCSSEIEAAGGFAQMPPEKIEALCLASARVRNHAWFPQMDTDARKQFDEIQIALAGMTKPAGGVLQ